METPDPDSPLNKRFVSDAEFKAWMDDPASADEVEKFWRAMSEGRFEFLPAGLGDLGLANHLKRRAEWRAFEKMTALLKKVSPWNASVLDWEKLAQRQEVLDELLDLGLELSEPNRTAMMTHLAALREQLNNARPD